MCKYHARCKEYKCIIFVLIEFAVIKYVRACKFIINDDRRLKDENQNTHCNMFVAITKLGMVAHTSDLSISKADNERLL